MKKKYEFDGLVKVIETTTDKNGKIISKKETTKINWNNEQLEGNSKADSTRGI